MNWQKLVIMLNLLHIGVQGYMITSGSRDLASDYFGAAAIFCSVGCIILVGTMKGEK